MTQPSSLPPPASSGTSLDASAHEAMRQREEVLEICYWYQGEGFGEAFTSAAIASFLPLPPARIAEILVALASDGDLVHDAAGYRFAEPGKKKASRLFHETFAEFQTPSHYECTAGCCDGDDHSGCDHGPLHTHVRVDTPPT